MKLYMPKPLIHLKQSRQGMRPTRWGPILWYFLFATLWYWEMYQDQKNYNKKRAKQLLKLVSLFKVLLYCRFCRDSFNIFYKETNPEEMLKNSNKPLFSILHWLHEIHEMVNEKLTKPAFPFELIEECYVTDELPEWEMDSVSPHYYYCFWCVLYLIACNYPPTVNSTSATKEFDQQIRDSTSQLIVLMIELFPSREISQQLHKQSPNTIFTTRTECFQFIYEWECRCNESSIFGSDIAKTMDYFESHFRTPEFK